MTKTERENNEAAIERFVHDVTGSTAALRLRKEYEMKKNLGVKNWMFTMPVLMIRLMGVSVAPAFSCGKELM